MSPFNVNVPIIDVRAWYRDAVEKRELLAMDDRMLRDIGLTRVDATRIASERSANVLRFVRRWPSHRGPISPGERAGYISRANRLRDKAVRDAFVALFRWLKADLQPIARLRKLTPVAR